MWVNDIANRCETSTLIYTIPTPPTAQYRAMVCKREEDIPPR